MASTYVNDLRLNEMATGDASGSWGTVTNTNLELIGEALGYGTQQVFGSDANATTTVADGAADPARAMYFKVTSAGNLTATRTMTVDPDTVSRLMFIENATSGSQSIAVKQGSGAGAAVTIPTGQTKAVILPGSGSGSIVLDAFAALSVVDLNVSGTALVTGVLTTTAATVSNGGGQFNGAINVGVNDTGYDVKFFGDTASAYMLWDASADDLILGGAAGLSVNSAALVTGVLTTTAATVFNGGFAANEISTITDATSFSAGLSIINTADVHGSVIAFFNNSSSPADNDYLGGLIFKGTNSAGGTHSYAKIFGIATDITDGTEDGSLTFETGADGANTQVALTLTNTQATFIGQINLSDDKQINWGDGTTAIGGDGSNEELKFFTNNVLTYTIPSDGSMFSTTLGTSNLRLGVNAGNSIASGGNYNVCIGDEAGTALTTGDNNVAIGFRALQSEDGDGNNIAIGADALQNLNAGATGNNVAIGTNAGNDLTDGLRNVIIGSIAGDQATTIDDCVIIGYNAGGNAAMTGHDNVLIGKDAGQEMAAGQANIMIGRDSGQATSSGHSNVAIGDQALATNIDGDGQVAIGFEALTTSEPANGQTYNVAVGYQAGKGVTTGHTNTMIGGLTCQAALTGTANVIIGTEAGNDLTSGSLNTFVGVLAGDATDDGNENTGIGYKALSANCGAGNTAVGSGSGRLVTGAANTTMGVSSGYELTSGSNNLILGQDAGRSTSPGGAIDTAGNTITLGNNSIDTANVKVDWTIPSDQRDKTDFTALDIGLDFVKALNPVTYKWDQRSDYGDQDADDWSLSDQTPDGTHKKDWLDLGFKAQEVEALEIAAGYNKANKTNLTISLNPDGEQYGMRYSKFVPILVKAIQEQNALIEALTARVATLEG